jgi:hypothetical protein
MYIIDSSGNIVFDPEVASHYNAFQDEYMHSIGITGDWRKRLQDSQNITNLVKTTEPGVLSQNSVVLKKAVEKLVPPPWYKNYTNWILIFLFLAGLIFLITRRSSSNNNSSNQ